MTYPDDPTQPHRLPPVETSYPVQPSTRPGEPFQWGAPTATQPATTLPAQTPKRKPRRWPHIIGYLATAGVFLGIGLGAGGSASADPNLAAPAPEVTVTVAPESPILSAPLPTPTAAAAKPTPTPKPKPVKATIPDGYSADIPGDIPAGRYKARSDSTDCFYNIAKTGSPDDIVDNGGFIKGSLTVTLKRGETFESHDCGDWTQQ